MAGAPLQSSVEINVRPSATATQQLAETSRKLDEIQTKARAAKAATASAVSSASGGALGTSNRFTDTGPALPGLGVRRRTLANMADLRGGIDVESNSFQVSAGGVKFGNYGSFGAGGFVLGKQSILKASMPILQASAVAHVTAGVIDGLATIVESSRKGSFFAGLGNAAEDFAKFGYNLLGGDGIADAIAKLDRTAGGGLMTRGQFEEAEKARQEAKVKIAEEGRRAEEAIRSQLSTQATTFAQMWLGHPDAYKMNRRVADHIDSVAAEARKLRERQLEVQTFTAGTEH